jgi:hypothetical protein
MALFIRLKCGLAQEEKFIKAGPAASWLWQAALSYSREKCTDGYIPKSVLTSLVPGVKGACKLAARLIDAGLFDDALGGYLIHDYLDWNPSRDEVHALRTKDRDRKRQPIPESPSDVPDGSPSPPSARIPDGAPVRAGGRAHSGSVSVSDSALESAGEESARETPPPDAAVVVRPVRPSREWGRGSLVKPPTYHEQHCPRWGLAACRWGFCLPKYLWPQWERRGQSTDAWLNSLQLFVEQVMDRTPPGGGDRVEEFWPRHFEAHFGTTAPKPTSGRLTAAQRTIATGRG